MLGKSKMDSNTLNFIIGISIGLEIELGNTTECIRRGTLTLSEFKMAVEYLAQGIEHLNLNDLEKGGESLGTALASIPELLKDCGVTKFDQDIKHAISLIKSGVLKFLVRETVIITAHGRVLFDDVKTMITSMRSEKYMESGIALGKILSILIQV
jgi:hypothetical protein